MGGIRAVFVCIVLICVALGGCSAVKSGPDMQLVTSSPLPGMEKYNANVGREFWTTGAPFELCPGSTHIDCQFLNTGTHVKIDGFVTNHKGTGNTSFDAPYYHLVLDDGRAGFSDVTGFEFETTTINPAVAAAECKRRGDPRIGMTAKQVAETCWGKPSYVNTKERKSGTYEQYVYGDNRFVYLRNDVVTSVGIKRRRFSQ